MRSRHARVGAALLSVIVPTVLFAAAPAHAAARTVDDACVFADRAPFTDRPAGETGVAIDCVAHYRVTTGVTPTVYDVAGAVRRDQMASFVVRLVLAANGGVNPTPSDHFADDTGNVHEPNINRLFETEITQGFTDGTYRPASFVTRAQMASFIARAIEHVTGSALPASTTNHFTDDNGNEHEARINQLADLGVVQGTTATRYVPEARVTRGQMALFLARALDYLTELRAEPLRRIDPSAPDGVIVDASAAPELVRAARIAGTQVVRFTFDEDVNAGALVASGFQSYSFAAARTAAEAVQRDSADPKSVRATFPSTVRLDLVTAVGVGRGAVQDTGGVLGIEGSSPLAAIDLAAGTTDAPDLVSASAVGSNNTLFNFQFDEPAYRLTNTGYRLVMADGSTVTSTGSTGDGTTTHTATFPVFSPGSVVRAYILEGTVSDAVQVVQTSPIQEVVEGNPNPQQAAPVVSGGQLLGRPDLLAVTLDPDADTVTYRFDENVTPVPAPVPLPGLPNAGTYRLYDLSGASVTSTDSVKSSTDPREIVVTFAPGQVNALVAGASVDEGAVRSTASGGENRVDELGIQTRFAAGQTAGPDLIGVGHTQAPSAAPPDSVNRSVVYLFDQPVQGVNLNGTFGVYGADGTRTAFTTNGVQPACTASGSRVTCTVNSVTSPALFAALRDVVKAGVDPGAVVDAGGSYPNPGSSSAL